MSSTLLILLCGPSYAGKTRLRRLLVERFGLPFVCPDEITAERGAGNTGGGLPTDELARSHRLALTRATDLIRGGAKRVVIDDTNCFRFLRDDYRRVADEHGAVVRVVAFRVPEDELRRRRSASLEQSDRHPVDERVFEEHVRTFEWPGDDERAEVVEAPADPDAEWIIRAGLADRL